MAFFLRRDIVFKHASTGKVPAHGEQWFGFGYAFSLVAQQGLYVAVGRAGHLFARHRHFAVGVLATVGWLWSGLVIFLIWLISAILTKRYQEIPRAM